MRMRRQAWSIGLMAHCRIPPVALKSVFAAYRAWRAPDSGNDDGRPGAAAIDSLRAGARGEDYFLA